MEKKTLLAVVLSAAVFILYYGFLYRPPTPSPSTVAGAKTLTESAPSTALPPDPVSEKQEATSAAKTPVELTDIETLWVKGELSSASGLPQRWWLKKYFVNPDKKGPNLDLLQEALGVAPMGLLLFPGKPPVYPHFEVVEKSTTSLKYHGNVDSLQVLQGLEFSEKDYTLEIKLTVENKGAETVALSPGLHLSNVQSPPSKKGFLVFHEAPNFKTPFYLLGNKVVRHPNVEKLATRSEEIGEIPWAGIEDRYFLRIILARNVSPQNRVVYGKGPQDVYVDLTYGEEALAPGQKKDYQFTIYLGPKDPALLKGFGAANLDKSIDYGWFGLVAVPILYTLKFFESILKNWGLAIIALTLLIKILLHPLTKKSMQSMKAMQTLQPQLQKLREKYKDDKERLNLETMSLFRTHKVNPMGGCLPMVIQMPIYIALYKVLYNATDLFHAPFFLFYRDLSAPDPYYILPILLGVFMVLQQKMTPSPSADPTQAKMMMIMPVMFSAFMLFLPVGLVLYIFVNTLMTVVQQYMYQHNLSLMSMFRGRKVS